MSDKKSMDEKVKDKLPTSHAYSWLLILGATLVAGGGGYQLFDGSDKWEVFFKVVVISGAGILGLWIAIFIIEILSRLVSPLKVVLKLLLLVPRVISRLYIVVVKILIKPAVIEIIDNKPHIGAKFILTKQALDDDYWDQTLDFNKLNKAIFSIKPDSSDYWRFGFKFSKDGIFPSARHEKNYPLFHLTKNLNERSLKVTYYDENIHNVDQKIIDEYDGEPLSIVFDKKDYSLRIRVLDRKNTVVYSEKYPTDRHSHAQVFAWGDKHEFTIDVRYSKK